MSEKHSTGVGFMSALVLVFIALKLTGAIDWPWVMIFAPWWVPLVLIFIVMIFVGVSKK